jgi:hypothetical protein
MEGSHSPFGFVWQIASATGWSVQHILWKVPYPTLMLMVADAPRYVSGGDIRKFENSKIRKFKDSKIRGGRALAVFQTRLKNSV